MSSMAETEQVPLLVSFVLIQAKKHQIYLFC